MTAAGSWNPATVAASLPVISLQGPAYRYHSAKRQANHSTGSSYVSGRYNCGAIHARNRQEQITKTGSAFDTTLMILDTVPERWEALYVAQDPVNALVEGIRHVETQDQLDALNHHLTTLTLTLSRVLDCTDLNQVGLTPEYMSHDADYRYTQALARAAFLRGDIEALLVPAATKLCDNVIIFRERLADPDSAIKIASTIHLPLRLGTLASGTLPNLTRPIQF
jgi:RES domain-containing protein